MLGTAQQRHRGRVFPGVPLKSYELLVVPNAHSGLNMPEKPPQEPSAQQETLEGGDSREPERSFGARPVPGSLLFILSLTKEQER